MKKLILIFILAFASLSGKAQITGDACVFVEEGGLTCFESPTIMVDYTYRPTTETYIIRLEFSDGDTTHPQGEAWMVLTKAEVDGHVVAAGTGETEETQNVLLQEVVDKLEAITENAGVTFTII